MSRGWRSILVTCVKADENKCEEKFVILPVDMKVRYRREVGRESQIP